MTNNKLIFSLLKKYELSNDEIEELVNVIESIYQHDEFQRRISKEFSHHDDITLGYHIIEVTILAYILSKRYSKNKEIDLNVALKIAMLHDLYTQPWQNNPEAAVNKFFNMHGFRHPIESVINGSVWFPEIFDKNKETEIIIDGIVHHMFPLPVAKFIEDNSNPLELRNFNYVEAMDPIVKNALINSSDRCSIGSISITPSIHIEGRIVSTADKIVSINNLKRSNINGIKALVTGKNKNLERAKVKELK